MGTARLRRRPRQPVDRETARAAEDRFFDRFAASLRHADGIYNPTDNRTYDATGRNRVTKTVDDRSLEIKALVKRFAEKDLMKTYEEMPRNGVVVHEVLHKELLGRPTVKVILGGAAVSPAEELVRKGASKRRATSSDLERIRELVVRNDAIFHAICAFSTTGWTEEARRSLTGPNWLIALVDINDGAWRTYYPPDPRWRSTARLFDLTSEEEKVASVRAWVKRHTFELLMDELTEDTVFEELGYALPIIREAFEIIAAEDPFVRFDEGARPARLVRTYG